MHRAVPCAALEFRILGPVQVWLSGVEVQLGGSKQRTVLAALLLAHGRVVTDGALSALLWGDEPPRTSGAQIYTYVSRLRRTLGDAGSLVRNGQGYALRAPGAWFDLDEYVALARRGRAALEQGRPDVASVQLAAALGLWRGAALGSGTEFLAETEAAALEESRLDPQELWVEAELALGRCRELISELTALVAAHPLRERFRAQLMTALWRSHRRADALRVFFEGRELLADELGVDPSPLLTELYEEIVAEPPDAPPAVPPVPATGGTGPAPTGTDGRGPATVPAMLPPDLADFTGRRSETDRLCRWLGVETGTAPTPSQGPAPDPASGRPRLALVSGPPGVGRSSLAVHVAQQARAVYPDGQLFVDLGAPGESRVPVRDVLAWFLRALGASPDGIPSDTQERAQVYRSLLARRRVLVVLENAVSDEQVHLLLPAGAGCGVLITSTEPLAAVPVDRQIDLGPFDIAEAMLFLRRAGAHQRVQVERAAALELIDSCGRFPLALRILSLQLSRKPHWTLRRMVAHLRAEATRLDRLQAGSLCIRPALDRLFDAVEDGRLTQLRILADLPTPTFTADAVGRLLGLSECVAEHILEYLLERRLLEVAGHDAGRRPLYSFPPLTRLAAREVRRGPGNRSLVEGA
ncbi:BTAD domain-containing putative transcriptional regulator [Nakamurella sp.]|uniref:AfsR/SARP family transcriptional regulator n=1 Tax=Nakamurella sp. TaxID=1869182 RepID=UPI003B3BA924